MSEAKFTPGPWRAKSLNGLRGTEGYADFDQAILGANNIVVGIVYEAGPKGFKHDPVNGFEANARLIAAAPNLFEALQQIVEGYSVETVAVARAALALARGEETAHVDR